MNETVEILMEAKRILSKRGAWTQGAFARSRSGLNWSSCGPYEKDAGCFCLIGAIRRANFNLLNVTSLISHVAEDVVANIVEEKFGNWDGIASFNDTPGRKKKEIIALLDASIASLSPTPEETPQQAPK